MPLAFTNKVSDILKSALTPPAGTPPIGSSYSGYSAALKSKINPTPMQPAMYGPTPGAIPLAPAKAPVVQKAATVTAPKIAPVPVLPTNAANTPPLYDTKSGLLTDYGRSQGAKEVNGPVASPYTPPSATPKVPTTGKDGAMPPSFGGILFDLLQKATDGNKNVQDAREDLTKFQTATSDKIADIRSQPIALNFQQGRAQAVQQASAEKEAALQSGVTNALTSQQQELGAFESAAGLAAPQQLPYSNQLVNPTTGLPVGGGGATGSLTDAVTSIAQKVQNGTIGYDDGVKALQGYGQAGINGLQAALGPNFNVQQSNASAAAQAASTLQTGTIGGELQKQAETVKTHMGTLQTAYDALGAQYGLPIINKGVNAIASQFGSGPLQSYKIALSNVRDELAKILGGGTSTDGTRATAASILPDNMTPEQIKAAITTATTLMNAKIEEYTKTPQFNNNGATGSGSGSIWDF